MSHWRCLPVYIACSSPLWLSLGNPHCSRFPIRVKAQVYITFVARFKNTFCCYITFVTQPAPLLCHPNIIQCKVTKHVLSSLRTCSHGSHSFHLSSNGLRPAAHMQSCIARLPHCRKVWSTAYTLFASMAPEMWCNIWVPLGYRRLSWVLLDYNGLFLVIVVFVRFSWIVLGSPWFS